MTLLQELTIRKALCERFIKELEGTDDPRAPSAILEYRRQLVEIDTKFVAAGGTPQPVVVQLKSAVLGASVPKEN